MKKSITVLGMDLKGELRETLKARRDSISWVSAGVWKSREWFFTSQRGAGFWKAAL